MHQNLAWPKWVVFGKKYTDFLREERSINHVPVLWFSPEAKHVVRETRLGHYTRSRKKGVIHWVHLPCCKHSSQMRYLFLKRRETQEYKFKNPTGNWNMCLPKTNQHWSTLVFSNPCIQTSQNRYIEDHVISRLGPVTPYILPIDYPVNSLAS